MGVAVLLISEIEAITGDFRATEAGISYLADNIVFLRYLEIQGELRRAIGVLKKRLSSFEPSARSRSPATASRSASRSPNCEASCAACLSGLNSQSQMEEG